MTETLTINSLFPLSIPDKAQPVKVSLGGHIIQTNKQFAPRVHHEFYPTPYELCVAALDLLPDEFQPKRICDPGAGTGVWCNAARAKWPNACIVGVEIRPEAKRPSSVNDWIVGSFVDWMPGVPFDLICGNPPYGDPEDQENYSAAKAAKKRGEKFIRPERRTTRADAEAFIRHAMKMLRDSAYLMFLLRLAFQESGKRKRLFGTYSPYMVDTCVDRPSFTGNGKTDATAYAVYTWLKGHYSPRWSGGLLDWKRDNSGDQLPLF